MYVREREWKRDEPATTIDLFQGSGRGVQRLFYWMLLSIELFDCCSLSRSLSECKHRSHEGEAEAAFLQMKGRLAWFSVGYASWEFEQIQYFTAVLLKPGARKPPRVAVRNWWCSKFWSMLYCSWSKWGCSTKCMCWVLFHKFSHLAMRNAKKIHK